MRYFEIIDYSPKAVALAIEKEGVLTDDLVEIGGRFNYRLSCGPGWIFSRKKSYEALCALLTAEEIPYKVVGLPGNNSADKSGKNSNGGKDNTPSYILSPDELRAYAKEIDYYDIDKFPKQNPIVVKLTGGECVPIGICKIKSEFWIPDENHDDEIEAAHTEEYFIAENCERYEYMIEILKGESERTYKYAWLANYRTDGSNYWSIDRSNISPESVNALEVLDSKEREMANQGMYRKLSEEDKNRLIVGYTKARDLMLKRCRAWLKRYGVKKISVRTYWADR